MADRRFNTHPGFSGGRGMPMGISQHGMGGVPGFHPYNQQMMMMPNMRFPLQGVRMGPPNTPPPPYSAHVPNPSVATRPRVTLDKTKGNHQLSDKERAFEEQRQKLRMFGKPGMTKVDPDALIGSMFAADTKKKVQENKKPGLIEQPKEEDDSFGDFLQGPSLQSESDSVTEKPTDFSHGDSKPELDLEPIQEKEKKDLDSMMIEFSDLNAPKKAKGFHKPTLNEVQKHGQHHSKARAASFHDSDHARSWKQQCDDLTGLFQMPEKLAPTLPIHSPTSAPVEQGTGNVPLPSEPAQIQPQHQTGSGLPRWYYFREDQLPPVYRHVWEASLVNDQIATERLYPILLMCGLPREKLAHIWSLCNTGTPGQLVQHELWAVLGLIALTQNNFNTNTLDILSRCPDPPVPVFAATQGIAAPEPAQPKPTSAAPEEDDFADFQAASAPSLQQAPHSSHTSPSFEEDYYTDGRDSLSQISTSEQSENEDIRNFENYVEEFNNQKKQPPGASPLHCPFPSLQQPHTASDISAVQSMTLEPSDSSKSSTTGPSLPPTLANQRNNNNLSFSTVEISSTPSLNTLLHTAEKFHEPTAQLFPKLSAPEGANEFSDFKSAALDTSSDKPDVREVSLIKEEDKYDALRAFSMQGDDVAQPSTFDQAFNSDHSTGDVKSVETGQEDDWADFTTAPAAQETWTTNNAQTSAMPASGPAKASKEDILTLFSKTETIQPAGPLFSKAPSNSAMDLSVDSEGNLEGHTEEEGKFETSFFDSSPSSDSLHTVQKPQFGYGFVTAPTSVPITSSSSSSSSLGPSFLHAAPKAEQFTAVFGNSTAESVAEDWGKYSSSSVSTSNPLEGVEFPAVDSTDQNDDWGDFSAITTSANVDVAGQDDWCNFNNEAEDGANREPDSQFVTIKKQNLGTSEILGLFKVRDDPTTLSSYQLPQQLQPAPMSRTKAQPSLDDDDGLGPPPMDFENDEDEEDLTFSRGYDLDDVMQNQIPATTYSVYGHTVNSAVYTQTRTTHKAVKETKEESGSVHSLELRTTSHPGDYSGSDSHSISSTDGQSKSTDSLDQQAQSQEIEEQVAEEESSQTVQTMHQPIKPHELLASMPDFGDKYNIENEAQGSDRYGYEWTRCLLNCCQVITEANTLFNTVSSSSVCNEVLKSNQGSQYIASIVEIYRVVCRVMTSMRSTAISTTELEQTLKNIDLAWNNLTAFLVGVSLLPDPSTLTFDSCIIKSDLEPNKNLACGLCLLNVDSSPAKTLLQSASSGCLKLTYAGRQYHSTCANFWVNCVDQTLPSLTLPELL